MQYQVIWHHNLVESYDIGLVESHEIGCNSVCILFWKKDMLMLSCIGLDLVVKFGLHWIGLDLVCYPLWEVGISINYSSPFRDQGGHKPIPLYVAI